MTPISACIMDQIDLVSCKDRTQMLETRSWQRCAERCWYRDQCTHWSWHKRDTPFQFHCYVCSSMGIVTENPNVVSGKKSCRGDKVENGGKYADGSGMTKYISGGVSSTKRLSRYSKGRTVPSQTFYRARRYATREKGIERERERDRCPC